MRGSSDPQPGELSLVGRIVATAASGLAYGLLFPPLGWAALAWVFLVPYLVASRLARPGLKSSIAHAGLFAALGTLVVVPWLLPTIHGHFERSWPFAVGIWLLVGATTLAPFYALALGLHGWVSPRLPAWARPVLFGAAWATAEWLRVQIGFRSPWMRLGDAFVDAAWLRQLADVTGVYGLSALAAMANAVVAEGVGCFLLRHREAPRWRPVVASACSCAALLAGVLAYGAVRERQVGGLEPAFEVAIVQGNESPDLRWRRATASRVLRRYGGITRDLLRDSPEEGWPDLVVWPESAIQTAVDDPVYGPPLLGLAKGSPILLGAPASELRDRDRLHFNSAHLIGPDGVIGRYDKRRLLPFSETHLLGGLANLGVNGDLEVGPYTSGVEPTLFEVGGSALAPLICMEALYPGLAREAARLGADVIVNLSHDGWFAGRGGREQHLAMVRFRAIETRLPVIRATATGVSAVVAPDGSLIASLGENERGVLRADVPARGQKPPYVRIGDAFAIACVFVTLLSLAIAGRERGSGRPVTE